MEPFKYHIYFCNQNKPEGAPSCVASGAEKALEVLRREVAKAGLESQVQITTCGCLAIVRKRPEHGGRSRRCLVRGRYP